MTLLREILKVTNVNDTLNGVLQFRGIIQDAIEWIVIVQFILSLSLLNP